MIITTDRTEQKQISEYKDMVNEIGPFVVDLAKQPELFKNIEGAVFDVSSRFIIPGANMLDYLKVYFMHLDQSQIDTVYGNVVYPSKLYGGRPYNLEHSMSNQHVQQLNEAGIGVSLTLTNHFFDRQTYDSNLDFLARFHKQGNTIVCTNDELAQRIRSDFPDYKLKASLIKHLNTQKKVESALERYDYVVIPMDKNDDAKFLEALPEKERIYLFGNASCAYNCPSRSCYVGISQTNQHMSRTSSCSIPVKPRSDYGHIYFDVKAFHEMGYHRFKMVPNQRSGAAGALKALSDMRQSKRVVSKVKTREPEAVVYSYPKCGRTWLRFILANYLNQYHRLGLPLNFQSIFALLPNDEDAPLKGRETFQFSDNKTIPMLSFSHNKLGRDGSQRSKSIVLLRSVLDVVVSDYFHQSKLLGSEVGELSEFIRDPKGGLANYLSYLNKTAEFVDDNTLVISYEGLHQNTRMQVEKLLRFMGLDVNESIIAQAIEAASFDNMAAIEQNLGIAGHSNRRYKDPEARRVRKGKIQGYTDYLSESDIVYCKEQAVDQLSYKAKLLLSQAGVYRFLEESTKLI